MTYKIIKILEYCIMYIYIDYLLLQLYDLYILKNSLNILALDYICFFEVILRYVFNMSIIKI